MFIIDDLLNNAMNFSHEDAMAHKEREWQEEDFAKQLEFNEKWNQMNYDASERWNAQNQANWEKSFDQEQKNWETSFDAQQSWNAQNQANLDREYNAQQSWNAQNQANTERNFALQEDTTYNGLGIRIADAERNGISKWAVAGNGATAGVVGSGSFGSGSGSASFGGSSNVSFGGTSFSHSGSLGAPSTNAPRRGAVRNPIDLSGLMQLATIREEVKNMQYQRNYAAQHNLPIGASPNIHSSLLGKFATNDNYDKVTDAFENALDSVLSNSRSRAEERIKKDFEKKVEKWEKKNNKSAGSYEKTMEQARKGNVKSVNKARPWKWSWDGVVQRFNFW